MATELTMPRLSQDMESGRIVEWLKKEGDRVERGEGILIVETDKAEMEVEAPESGVVIRILTPAGNDAAIGSTLAVIGAQGESWQAAAPAAPAASPVPTQSEPAAADVKRGPTEAPTAGRLAASPAAKRLARELAIDLAKVVGTGAGGLIGEADVQAYAERTQPAAVAEGAGDPDVEIIPLEGMRRRIAERMTLSRQSAADVTTVIDVDMGAVARLRKQSGLSFTTYVAWAVAHSLLEFPDLNATFANDQIRRRKKVDLGVAVALDSGLVVPVLRDAQAMTPAAVEAEIGRLAELAREGKAKPSDLSGASFTVTNSGTFGSLFFTPIINVPEVAILGVGRVADVPVVKDGQVVPGKVMYLCLSYDHRVVDGATAVKFLAAVKRRLQEVETEATE